MDGLQDPIELSPRARQLAQHLFPDGEDDKLYAVLDAAQVRGLVAKLDESGLEHCCLFTGELQPGVEARAPHLVKLELDDPLTPLLLDGFGKSWGIYAATDADFLAVRKHFRTFLMVRSPEGKALFFRYYDPRVFNVYLPTCTPSELDVIFGPLDYYAFEDSSEKNTLLRFRRRGALLKTERLRVPAPQAAATARMARV